MPDTPRDRVLALVRQMGILRSRDLAGTGIPRLYLRRLHAEGLLDNPERGLYVLADAEPTERHSLAEACKRVPHGVVCLLSALQFHGAGEDFSRTWPPAGPWLANEDGSESGL